MAKPNATSIRSFRKADEEQKRSRQQLKRQRELRQIAEKAEIQRAIDEEQKRVETERFREKRNQHATTRISNAFRPNKTVEISEQEVENKLNKAFIPTKTFAEPFEQEPALNRELAEFKKKIHEHIAQLGLSHSSGGGSSLLSDLNDVQVSSAKIDGQLLSYSSSTDKWVGATALTADNILLDGTDSSSTNAGSGLVLDTNADAGDAILYEDATTDFLLVLASHGITLAGLGWNALQFDNG